MIQILPHIMYLKTLVKILLQIMFLNMKYKTQRISQNTRNSDFLKNREIRQFAFDISSSSAIRPILFTFEYSSLKTFTTTATDPSSSTENRHRQSLSISSLPYHCNKARGLSPFLRAIRPLLSSTFAIPSVR